MKKIIIPILCLTLVASCDQKPDSKETTESINEHTFEGSHIEKDVEFASKAAEGGLLEVQLGELAQQNAYSSRVKEFGEMMVKDHRAANDELKKIALEKKIALPAMLGDEKMKLYNDLKTKTGTRFDEAYMEHMVKDHKKDIELFKKESEEGNDAELKNWATNKLPTLEHHLLKAQEAEELVN